MNKYLLGFVALVLILGGSFWFAFVLNNPASTDDGFGGFLPSSDDNPQRPPTFPNQGGENGNQSAQDTFSDDLIETLIDRGQATPSVDGVTVTFVADEEDQELPYVIFYVTSDNSFQIVLEEQPIGKVRREAEAAFLSMTNFSESQACALRYQVVAPLSVDETHGGGNIGFSFCPGSVILSEI